MTSGLILGAVLFSVGVVGSSLESYLLYALWRGKLPPSVAEVAQRMSRRQQWLLALWLFCCDLVLGVVGMAILALPEARTFVAALLEG